MTTMANKKRTIEQLLTDPTVPMKMRREMIRQVCAGKGADEEKVISIVLEAATLASAGQHYVQKTRELQDALDELAQGPMRCATFDRIVESDAYGRRAELILPDGASAFCSIPDSKLAQQVRCGDTVWLDAQGTAVLFHRAEPAKLGEQGRLERVLPHGDVEVSVNEMGHYVCRATAQLRDQIESGEAEPGCTLVVCPRRLVAWRALPAADLPEHRGYLARGIPDVLVERDVGAPPAFIELFSTHMRRELTAPELGRSYGLRRSRMLLATGVAGSGKTLSIQALWRRMYEVMAEITGAAIEDLPQRVLRLDSAGVLSKWLGESDKNISRFFDQVEKVADEVFEAPDGNLFELPVLVICEEIDALARQRGSDGVHDRIQSTLLTRLDPDQPLFRNKLVIVVCTTNIPGALDVAFVRRAGGTIVSFGRADRFSFRAILEKQLGTRPFQGGDEVRREALADITSWLFAPNAADPGQVEISYVGQQNPVVMHRRDFVTAGLVDRAVQQAMGEACDAEWSGSQNSGVTAEMLMAALDQQVRAIVDQLSPENCTQYLTLPDAVRVGTVRRIPQPAVLPAGLLRAANA
jgi:ATP-dependent 26S proteasome regulatory subunit